MQHGREVGPKEPCDGELRGKGLFSGTLPPSKPNLGLLLFRPSGASKKICLVSLVTRERFNRSIGDPEGTHSHSIKQQEDRLPLGLVHCVVLLCVFFSPLSFSFLSSSKYQTGGSSFLQHL